MVAGDEGIIPRDLEDPTSSLAYGLAPFLIDRRISFLDEPLKQRSEAVVFGLQLGDAALVSSEVVCAFVPAHAVGAQGMVCIWASF